MAWLWAEILSCHEGKFCPSLSSCSYLLPHLAFSWELSPPGVFFSPNPSACESRSCCSHKYLLMKTGIKNATDVAKSKSILKGLMLGVKLQSVNVQACSFAALLKASVQHG